MNLKAGAGLVALGLVVGAGGLRLAEFLVTDGALREQRATLVTLERQLRDREQALAAGQSALETQAASLKQRVHRAVQDADHILDAQGSAAERLRSVADEVRRLRDDLKSLESN
jgi:chromosome segregation ATPase